MPHGRLFWRVYLHGIGILLLIAAAVGLAGWAFGRTPAWQAYPERLATYLSARAADLDKPEVIERDLNRERELLGVEATLYRIDGTKIASNVEPPVAPLDAPALARLQSGPVPQPRRHVTAAPIRSGGQVVAYVAIGGMPFGPHRARALLMLVVTLVALAVGTFPLARAITSPLEKLTEAARRLGSGDLSARAGLKKRNDEVGVLATEFDQMADRLEKLVRAEKELLANVSHELRTPLSRIRVALELAAEGDGEKARRYLQEITADLSELERLVDDVLTAARMDLMDPRGGALPLRLEKVPSGTVVEAAAERFKAARPERKLEVALGAGLPDVMADPALLRRVVDNLLDNAAKYSEVDKPIRLSATADDGKLNVAVADQGIGIEEKDLPDLFRPFFRTERSRSRKAGGVGLGLALAKRIVEAHGGTIAIESAPGKGTTVKVGVPAAKA